MIWLTFGVLTISFVTTHAWWSKVRVVRLRQDIFDIRDALFDVAGKVQAFGDPAYRDARRQLNSVARIADAINVHTLAYFLSANVPQRERLRSNCAELQKAIDNGLEECTDRISSYLRYETFTGLVVIPFAHTIRMTALLELQLTRWIRRWLISSAPEFLDQARQHKVAI